MKWTDEIKLDFDRGGQKRMSIKRIGYIARLLRLPIESVEAFRTSKGVHVKMKLKEEVHPITAVLIQSLMGSDYAREAYNAIRVYNLALNPEKYSSTAHETWNVLFEEKYVDGRVVSREEYDDKLTKRLRRELKCT